MGPPDGSGGGEVRHSTWIRCKVGVASEVRSLIIEDGHYYLVIESSELRDQNVSLFLMRCLIKG